MFLGNAPLKYIEKPRKRLSPELVFVEMESNSVGSREGEVQLLDSIEEGGEEAVGTTQGQCSTRPNTVGNHIIAIQTERKRVRHTLLTI